MPELGLRSLLIMCLVLLAAGGLKADVNPEPGVLDLRDWVVEPGARQTLDGDWLIRWHGDHVPEPYSMPGVWNGRKIAGEPRSGFGHAVLKVQLLLPERQRPLSLQFDNIKSAARIFVDGELVAERGRPAPGGQGEIADLGGLTVPLPEREQVTLELEISNHFHAEGGIDQSVVVGDRAGMERAQVMDRSWSLLAVGSILGLAVYLLALGGWRRTTSAGWLFVALLGVSLMRFAAVSGLLDQIPGIPAALVARADYLSAFVFPGVYALLLAALFPRDVPRWLVAPIVVVSVALALTILLPVSVFTTLRDPTAVFVIFSVLLLLATVVRSAWNQRAGARLVLLGAALLALAVVNDALVAARILDSGNLIIPGALGCLILHGLVLGGRFFDAMEQNVRLSERLAELNQSLEKQVQKRTMDLEQESALLDGTLEAMAPAVLATTPSGHPQAWNSAFIDLFRLDTRVLEKRARAALVAGLKHSLGETAPVTDMLPSDSGQTRGRQQVDLPGGDVVEVARYRRADGGWVCSFVDVTARRVSEVGPQGGGVGTWEWDLHTGVFRGSSRFWSTLGYDPRAMDARRIRSRYGLLNEVHADDRDNLRDALDEALARGVGFDEELRVRRKSGEWLWIAMRTRVVRDRLGVPVRMVGVQTDIHAVVEARRALERARDNARADAEEKGRLLAVLSHEMRTPLHGILGQMDLLSRGDPLPEHIEPRLALIRRTSHEMVTLLEDILAMSGVETGRQPLRDQRFSPQDLLDHVVSLLEPCAEGWGLGISVRVADAIPRELRGDYPKLRQILLNLLDNGVKFTDTGGVSITMDIVRPGVYRFVIADSGCGMPPEVARRVFDAFYQAPDSPGSGLGLFIVGRLTRILGGEIRVESDPPNGSRFIIELPLDVPSDTVDTTPEPASTPRPAGLRILLVEDDEINRETVAEIFAAEGHHVVAVESAEAAVTCATECNRLDVILMDLRLPGMSGIEALSALREQTPVAGVPVVAFTAEATPERADAFLEAGGTAVLTKPLDLDAFYTVLGGGGVEGAQDASELCEPEDRWGELEQRVGKETVVRLLGVLEDNLAQVRHTLAGAVERRDWQGCRDAAHRVCGSAANYGLRALEALAARVSEAPDAAAAREAGELQATLDAELDVLSARRAAWSRGESQDSGE